MQMVGMCSLYVRDDCASPQTPAPILADLLALPGVLQTYRFNLLINY